MTEADASIPENDENVAKNEATIVKKELEKAPEAAPAEPAAASAAEPGPPKKGRPVGSKDRVPRRRVKIEPLVTEAESPQPSQPSQRQQRARAPSPEPPEPPPPEPPSPRTLYRQTSEQLVNLRDLMTHQRRVKTAESYAGKLHTWTGV